MTRVVVAGSQLSSKFAVIDFTNPNNPTVVKTDAGWQGGAQVTLDGSNLFVGNLLTGEVQLYDVSNPATPTPMGSITTTLNGIGAIAAKGNLVTVGEWQSLSGALVDLIDFSTPSNPNIIGQAITPITTTPTTSGTNPNPGAITSIAFLSNNVVVAAGNGHYNVVVVDFTNPNSPAVNEFNPYLQGAGPQIDADSKANQIVAGDSGQSGIIELFDGTSPYNKIGTANTSLTAITSIALSQGLTIAGSSFDLGQAVLVDFTQNPATKTPITTIFGGASTVAIDGTTGACGDVNGSTVQLFDLTQSPPAPLGSIDSQVQSIGTLYTKSFTAPVPQTPKISVSPTALAFGNVRVGSPSQLVLKIQNTGNAQLKVTAIKSSDPHFVPSQTGPVNIAAGQSSSLNITYTPTLQTVNNANLTINSNAANGTLNVPLSGTGGLPQISISPTSLNLGNVPVCESGTSTMMITNSGGIPLNVTSIISNNGAFSPSVPSHTSAIVQPNGSLIVTVTFKPQAIGAANGALTVASNDPTTPSANVTLTGNGLPTPPPSVTVNPTSENFGPIPVNYGVGKRITVANSGPCQALQVTLTSSGPPFYITIAAPISLPPMNPPRRRYHRPQQLYPVCRDLLADEGSKRFRHSDNCQQRSCKSEHPG